MLALQHLRQSRPLRAWGLGCALAAALALALLPTLSRAMAAPAPHLAVCTADGVRWVAADPADAGHAGADPGPDALLQACAMCLLAGSALAPPPPAERPDPLAVPAAAPPSSVAAPVLLAPLWSAGLPRAPPRPLAAPAPTLPGQG